MTRLCDVTILPQSKVANVSFPALFFVSVENACPNPNTSLNLLTIRYDVA